MKTISGDQGGFTLMELLVALGIVAIMVTLLYETMNAVLRTTRQVEETAEIHQMARISMDIMADELRSSYWRKPEEGESSAFIFYGKDGLLGGQSSDTLRFTTLSYARRVVDAHLSLLEYELVPVPNADTAVLMHREETNLLSLSNQSLEEYELADQVKGLNLRYFDGKDWVDEWSAVDRKRLPEAVEIKILFMDRTGRERSFITQTEIPVGRAS